VAGSIDRRTFCLFPFRFDTARSEKHQPPCALPSVAIHPVEPLRCSSHPSGNPIRRLLYSYLKYWRGEGGRPSLFLPAFPTRLATSSLLSPRSPDGTYSLSSLGLHEEVGHLHPTTSPSLKAKGAKSSERSERATREGADLVVGKLAIIFRGLFAFASKIARRE